MHRSVVLAAAAVLVSVISGYAEEPNPKVERPAVQSERPKPEAERKPAAFGQVPRAQSTTPQAGGLANAWGGGKSAAEWYIERTDKIARLSNEQKEKITALFESRDKAIKDFQASIEPKVKSVSAGMAEAFKSKNQEDIAKTQKAYQELYAPMHEIMKKSETALQNVLTAEQKAKLQDHQLTSLLTAFTPGVELSDDQRKQIKAGVGQAAGDHEAWERKLPELIDKTLTADQVAVVLKQRAMSYVTMLFGNAKLTSDQLKKVEAKVAELIKDHKKTVQLDVAIYQKLSEHVNGLLTGEQKELLKTQRAWVATAPGAGGTSPYILNTAPGAPAGGRVNPAPGAAATNPTLIRKPADRKVSESMPANIKVTQIPGGGIQVTIGEGAEAKEGKAAQEQMEKVRQQLAELTRQSQVSAKTSMRERIKRQHELTKKASKLMKKIDSLGEGEKAKAHELWEELEQVEGQLRKMFSPAQVSFMPGQSAQGWVVQSGVQLPGATLNPAPQRVGAPAAGAPLTGASIGTFTRPTAPLGVAPGGVNPDVRSELQALRRQLEELRAQLQKLSEKK